MFQSNSNQLSSLSASLQARSASFDANMHHVIANEASKRNNNMYPQDIDIDMEVVEEKKVKHDDNVCPQDIAIDMEIVEEKKERKLMKDQWNISNNNQSSTIGQSNISDSNTFSSLGQSNISNNYTYWCNIAYNNAFWSLSQSIISNDYAFRSLGQSNTSRSASFENQISNRDNVYPQNIAIDMEI